MVSPLQITISSIFCCLYNSSHGELNGLARDRIFLESSELLASRLKEKIFYNQVLSSPFTGNVVLKSRHILTSENEIVHCNNVAGTLNKLGVTEYDPNG